MLLMNACDWNDCIWSCLIDEDTVPNLDFTDEKKLNVRQRLNHQNGRVWDRKGSVKDKVVNWPQNPTSAMVWTAITYTGGTSLVFVPSGVKFISQRYISDILEAELLPQSRKHLNGAPWTFQQDSVPSHSSKLDLSPHTRIS